MHFREKVQYAYRMLGVSVFGFGLAFKAGVIIILRYLNFSKLPNIVER